MRGASALQEVLDDFPEAPISILVVWEPVILTDLYPPTAYVLSRVTDRRAVQFWDEDLSLSRYIVRSAIENPSLLSPGDTIAPDTLVWDFIAVFPPGATWSPLSRPSYHGVPVVDVIDQVRSALATSSP